eukprot:1105296-Ditylum_brightwellii.AAC.1
MQQQYFTIIAIANKKFLIEVFEILFNSAAVDRFSTVFSYTNVDPHVCEGVLSDASKEATDSASWKETGNDGVESV